MEQEATTTVEAIEQLREKDDAGLMEMMQALATAFATSADDSIDLAKKTLDFSTRDHAACLQNIATGDALVAVFLERIFQKLLDLEKQAKEKIV